MKWLFWRKAKIIYQGSQSFVVPKGKHKVMVSYNLQDNSHSLDVKVTPEVK